MGTNFRFSGDAALFGQAPEVSRGSTYAVAWAVCIRTRRPKETPLPRPRIHRHHYSEAVEPSARFDLDSLLERDVGPSRIERCYLNLAISLSEDK